MQRSTPRRPLHRRARVVRGRLNDPWSFLHGTRSTSSHRPARAISSCRSCETDGGCRNAPPPCRRHRRQDRWDNTRSPRGETLGLGGRTNPAAAWSPPPSTAVRSAGLGWVKMEMNQGSLHPFRSGHHREGPDGSNERLSNVLAAHRTAPVPGKRHQRAGCPYHCSGNNYSY